MPDHRPARAALATLIILQTVMLASLFAGVQPHPPATIAPFAMAPFLAAAISAAASALLLWPSPAGRVLAVLAVAMALVSYGPQKLLDPALPLIWPILAAAWVAMLTLLVRLARPGN